MMSFMMLFVLGGTGLFVAALMFGGIFLLVAGEGKKKGVGAAMLGLGLLICGGIAALIYYIGKAEGVN